VVGRTHESRELVEPEADDTQEINYPPIMRAIVGTGYKGYVAHEFIPKRDAVQSLRQAVAICDV
jgi:hydroxypyruvate isomerase